MLSVSLWGGYRTELRSDSLELHLSLKTDLAF